MVQVSVIIPVYNRAHLLPRAVHSVLAQSFREFELLIIDDCSTDGAAEVVRSFTDPRVVTIRLEENQGASAARNSGIQRAAGQYVAFLDSDDEWLPKKLERQLEVFRQGSERLGVVYTDQRKIAWKYEPRTKKYSGDISQRILVNNFVGGMSTPLIRRFCLLAVGGFDEDVVATEDWDLWIRLAQNCEFQHLDQELVHYHHQQVSLTLDREASRRGLQVILERHQTKVAELPPRMRADQQFHQGRQLIMRRQIARGVVSLAKSVLIHPGVIPSVADYLVVEGGRKLLDRFRKS